MAKKTIIKPKKKIVKKQAAVKKPLAKSAKVAGPKKIGKKPAKAPARPSKPAKKRTSAKKPAPKPTARKSAAGMATSARTAARQAVGKAKKQYRKHAKRVTAAAERAMESVKSKAHAAGARMSDVLDSATEVVATTAGVIMGAIEAATKPTAHAESASSATQFAGVPVAEPDPSVSALVEEDNSTISK